MIIVFMSISLWAQVAVLDYIGLFGTGKCRFIQVLYLGRAPRTKETLPDFLKWRRVTRHPLVFRGLTGSQRTPGFGASQDLLFILEWGLFEEICVFTSMN